MAELGNINYTNVNAGTSRVDRSAELGGIAAGLQLTGSAAKGMILAGVEDDLEDAMNAGIAGATDQKAETTATKPMEELTPDDLAVLNLSEQEKTEVLQLTNRIRQAKNAFAQAGDTGRRNRALLEIKRAQDAAKAKYGFMSDEIDRAAATLQTTSHALFAAALDDQAMADSLQARQAEYDFVEEMRESGKKLGIPDDIPIEDPRWAVLYKKESKKEFDKISREREYAALAAGKQLAAPQLVAYTIAELTKDSGFMNETFYTPLLNDLSAVAEIRGRVQLGTATEEDLFKASELLKAKAAQWQARAFQNARAIRTEFFQTWTGISPESPEYKQAWAATQAAISDMELAVQSLAAGDVNIIDQIKAQSVARGANMLDQMPNLQQMIDIGNVSNFDVWTTFGNLDHVFGEYKIEQAWADGLREDLTNVYGRYAKDKAATKNAKTPEELDDAITLLDSNDPNSGGLTDSPKGSVEHIREVYAMNVADIVATGRTSTEDLAVPGKADSMLFQASVGLKRLQEAVSAAKLQGVNVNAVEEVGKVIDWVSGDLFLELVQAGSPNQRSNLGHMIGKYLLPYGDVGPSKQGLYPQVDKFREIRNKAQRTPYGRPLIDLVTVDASKLKENGSLVFKLDRQLAEKVVRETLNEDARRAGSADSRAMFMMTQSLVEEAIENMEKEALELSSMATRYLRIRAYQNMKTDQGRPPNFNIGMISSVENTSLMDIFGLDNAESS